MFLKLDLFVICTVLFYTSEVKSDCDDFISCVGTWIGNLLVNDKKEIAVKTVKVPDTLSDVSDILSNITQLIVDNFDSVTKETSLVKDDNRTVVHVETFKVDDSLEISNQQIRVTSTELPKIIDNNVHEPKETNKIVNNILINVILNPNENQTASANVYEKVDDLKVTTEKLAVTTDFVDLIPTNSGNYSAVNGVIEDTNTTNKDDPYKVALGGEYLVHNTSELETYNNNITSDLTVTNKNVIPELPVNTFIEFNNASNIKKQNASNIFINIPKNVATNYKITFESPINVTHLEINTEGEKKVETIPNKTITNIKYDGIANVKDDIEHQNILENEIIVTDDDYNIEDNNASDYLAIDYIEIYKDTTNEEVGFTLPLYTTTTTQATSPSLEITEANGIESTYPWIATVFIKNNDNNQFEYICDGGLMSNTVILTETQPTGPMVQGMMSAARCVMKSNETEDVNNILVILGKRSLQATGPNEKVLRVKSVKLHENFTAAEGKVDNDLAIIVLAEPILFNDDILPVPWKNDEFNAIQSATTGWHVTGRLTPIFFEAGSSKTCKMESEALNTFCATFGDDITTCPSFGGLFVSRRADTEWCLQGITTGNPTSRGVCFNKDVNFTNISNYYQWVIKNIDDNKDD